MRIFALELNNDIKGIEKRKKYIESLISRLPQADIVLLPELSICSYMASQKAWQYADRNGMDTAVWAIHMARKYHLYIGVGYLDYDDNNYYNRYLIADPTQVLGTVTKSEGEAAVFKRGDFGNIIPTPFGNVAVGICYDAKRKKLYDHIKDEKLSLIVFPHGAPADPKKPEAEMAANAMFCEAYGKAFDVPVVYVNSVGRLEYMPGKMGKMMEKAGFTMNGRSKIYFPDKKEIPADRKEAIGADIEIIPRTRKQEIRFYGDDLIKGNFLFRQLILKPDIKYGIGLYENALSARKKGEKRKC